MTTRATRTIAASAAALLIASGLTVGTGAAVASADEADTDVANCAIAQSVTFNDISTAWTDYTLTKEVVGDGTAAPGGKVTFRTTASGAGALISQLEDFHPAGFELVKARHSVWKLLGGQSWANVTDDVARDSSANSVSISGAGWTTAGNAKATLETTYKVPADAVPGDKLNTGAAMNVVLASGRKVANPIDTCVTIREPNPVEAVTGSLDGLGLGSLTAGSTTFGNIVDNPAAFSAEFVNQLDMGALLSGLAGS